MAFLKYIGPEKKKIDPYYGEFQTKGKPIEVPDSLARERVISNPTDWAIDAEAQKAKTPRPEPGTVNDKKMDYGKGKGGK
jgi:hypothetical protein